MAAPYQVVKPTAEEYQPAVTLDLLSTDQAEVLRLLHERVDGLSHLSQRIPKWMDTYIVQVREDLKVQGKLYSDAIAVLEGDLHIKTRDLMKIQAQIDHCSRILKGFDDHISSLKDDFSSQRNTAMDRLIKAELASTALLEAQETLVLAVNSAKTSVSRLEDAVQKIESRVSGLHSTTEANISAAFLKMEYNLAPLYMKLYRWFAKRCASLKTPAKP